MDWATDAADGSASEQAVADAIQDALGGVDPPFEPGEKEDLGEGWELLDGFTYGECDEQAHLMELAVRILGVPAQTRLVYASTDAGAGNCVELDARWCPLHGVEFLCLDFYGGGTPANMNQFEGCCAAADHYYSVWPKHKATNDYTMLVTLGASGVTQHWCWWDAYLEPEPWYYPCNGPDATPEIP